MCEGNLEVAMKMLGYYTHFDQGAGDTKHTMEKPHTMKYCPKQNDSSAPIGSNGGGYKV